MAITIPNQWAGTFAQSLTFGTTPPAIQSVVLPLTVANSVGGGSGTPTAGNWLITIVGWNQSGLPYNQAGYAPVTVGVGDDIHSFWRPGNESTSVWAQSQVTANTRTSVWYTANTASAPGNVYVAPSGMMAGIAVLVVEVAGMGAWDTVSGIYPDYAAAATSLNLTLAAPASQALIIGAVTGDNSANGQAFAPASWTTLHTTTATNGTDHTCDAEITAAYIVTSGSINVNASATSATDLSGVAIGLLTAAASPIPATQNPNWPLIKVEAAFGAGYQTPLDQMTWTDLTSRCWSFDETTGYQFQLGQLQASNVSWEFDNVEGNLSPLNVGSPFYTNALTSNPAFQAGVSSWTGTNNAVIAAATTPVFASRTGAISAGSMKVTPDGVTATPGAISGQVAINNVPGQAYSASCYLDCPAGWATGAQITISWYNSSHTLLSTSSAAAVALVANTWTQITLLNQSPPANAAFAACTVQLSGTPSAATVFYAEEAGITAGPLALQAGCIATGTPVRMRAALGTMAGTAYNRWYVIHRNANEWAERINDQLRRFVAVAGSDGWSALSASATTPYRSEIYNDFPYAWWPMDDQPGSGGILPATLRNAAAGNSNTLAITVSPNGATLQTLYATDGTSLTTALQGNAYSNPPTIAQSVGNYTVAAETGWMYGDPQSPPAELAFANPVTQNPGSAAWQALGQQGNTGSFGYFLTVNDAGFPVLANGATVEGWFKWQYLGGANGLYYGAGTHDYDIAQQPVTALSLWEIATGSNPVAVLQLSSGIPGTGGNLSLITYNGASGTTNSIYTTSDLRDASWHHYAVVMTTTTWTVYVDGGLTAKVSGTATGMTSAWTWLVINGDLAANGGSSAGTGLVHGGNVEVSHFAVYPRQLQPWRILAHYCAAATGFGLLPAPQAVQVSPYSLTTQAGATTISEAYSPDGTAGGSTATTGVSIGGYGRSAGTPQSYAFSAVAAAVAGTFHSGPSARAAITGIGASNGAGLSCVGQNVFVSWSGLSPVFYLYTASQAGTETQAAQLSGISDTFTGGYGSTATDTGVSDIATGDNSSPASSASALGDTVGQRIERLLGMSQYVVPLRCIDPSPLAVQAPGTEGTGLQGAQLIQQLQASDSGLLFVDNNGYLTYWQKTHLAGQYSSPVWKLGPTTGSGEIPYYKEQIQWRADPQKIWNVITIQPFAPDGAQLALIVPANSTAVQQSIVQNGPEPLQIVSWLQSTTEMQSQANWLFTNYGQSERRADNVKVDAAPYPPAWPLILGINVGDVVTAEDWQPGGGGINYTYRASEITRRIEFGGQDGQVTGSADLTLDWEPSSYWS